ncbi:protein-disulfide reductase DsbD domain-containing protein [Verrucomicrobium spinosum]|uniref:protein-disulfide reductase DsbD domain-containing protein n=1 Tax=Verrucomicrobium spinosum TaxID=2736 RepID=UPI000174533E|nr:protein-disulfide reductase DsbD domain-containing protein [Verrucomicrobium spinosum]
MPAFSFISPLPTLLAFPAALVLTLAGSPARAAEPLDVTLVANVTQVQPGVPFYAGLHLVHREGYHTYWKFPGIVGVPTSMDWTLPPGWKAEDITWPEPKQVHMFQIRAQGYHGDMLLPVLLTPPKDLVPGTKVTLKGKTSWMCCGRDCNPGFNDLTLDLPVAAAGAAPETLVDTKWQERFAAALASSPKPLKGWIIAASRDDKSVVVNLTPTGEDIPKGKIKDVLFFTDDGLVNADKDQVLEQLPNGALRLTLEVSQYAEQPLAKRLVGVLQSKQGWDAKGTNSVAIDVPLIVLEPVDP